MNAITTFFAMAAPQGTDSPQSPYGFMGMMVLFFVIMYVMMIRPQQRKEKERKAMLAELKKGDKVLFAGGLIGSIAQIGDKTAKIKVSDNVRLDVARGAITAIITDEDDVIDPVQG
ncbi:MAG: preprotein translocase subunit YajC [Kiritimatiellia bacterium]